MKLKQILVLTVVAFSVIWSVVAFAEDELRLCGIVKKLNPGKMTTMVDVKSLGAKGLHKFKLSDSFTSSSFRIGTRQCFYIDSNQFKEVYVYTIIENERD